MAAVEPSRTILHADMDAFYAAVEQRDDPGLRGLPVIVGGLGRRGVVSTASYEARAFGVHSAMPTAQARRLCAHGVYLRPRMATYAAVSAQLRALFDAFTDRVEPLSLDEAFLEVTGSQRLFGSGEEIARALRRRVREETGLTVSVGVAGSKFVAKVASDLRKPDGLTIVPPGGEAAFLAPLPTSRLWGAGPATQARLLALGCRTLGDVAALAPQRLVAALGESLGRHVAALAQGHDERPVVVDETPRSVGRETTFEFDLVEEAACLDVLLALSEDVGRRLRRLELKANTVRLKLRHPPFETHTRQHRLPEPTHRDARLYAEARALFNAARPGRRPVRLLGVTAADLQPARAERQAELFTASAAADEEHGIDQTLDAIRQRFGPGAAHRMGRGTDRGTTSPPAS